MSLTVMGFPEPEAARPQQCGHPRCEREARIVVTVEVIGRPGFESRKPYCSDAHALDDMAGG